MAIVISQRDFILMICRVIPAREINPITVSCSSADLRDYSISVLLTLASFRSREVSAAHLTRGTAVLQPLKISSTAICKLLYFTGRGSIGSSDGQESTDVIKLKLNPCTYPGVLKPDQPCYLDNKQLDCLLS